MSLIVCSSQQDRYGDRQQGNSRAYSFQNYLGNAMEIPPHSEVAVQSVKYNRRGVFKIEGGVNNLGFFHFGPAYTLGNLATPADNFIDDYTSSLLPFVLDEGEYKAQEFCNMAFRKMNEMCEFHPDLECDSVTPVFDANDILETIEWAFDQKAAPASVKTSLVARPLIIAKKWDSDLARWDMDLAGDGEFTQVYTWAGGISAIPDADTWDNTTKTLYSQDLTGIADDVGVTACILPQAYMSWNDGSLEFDMTTSKPTAGLIEQDEGDVAWQVGLVRAQAYGTTADGYHPDGSDMWKRKNGFAVEVPAGNWDLGYNPDEEDTAGFLGLYFYDYVVSAEEGDDGDLYIRVYASGHISNELTEDDRYDEKAMDEVEYWKEAGKHFHGGGPYNYTSDGGILQNIKWMCSGDEVTLQFKMNGVWRMVMGKSSDGWERSLPPVTATKYRLYPKMAIFNEKELEITVEAMTGREQSTLRPYGSCYYGVAYNGTQEEWYGYGEDADSSDSRIGNCVGSKVTAKYTPGGFIDYEMMMVMDWIPPTGNPQLVPHWISDGANVSDTMGFLKQSIVNWTDDGVAQGSKGINFAGGIPTSNAKHSYFVACKTLTQISQNFGKGTPSKIIYHIPQFSNSGGSTGALYFEATEKTYLTLGNTETLSLNTIDIDIIDKDEKLADDLEGNTVVVLHIRREGRR